MHVVLTDTHIEILLGIAGKMHLPEGLNDVERVELAFDALVNAYDSQQDVEEIAHDPGTPINAATLAEAMQRVVSPNISTDFVQPTTEEMEKPKLTLDELLEDAPQNTILKNAKATDDPILTRAVEITFNAIHPAVWADTVTMSAQVAAIYQQLVTKSKEAPTNN